MTTKKSSSSKRKSALTEEIKRNKMFIALSRNKEQIASDRAKLISKRSAEVAEEILTTRRRSCEDIEAEIASKFDISALPDLNMDNRVRGDNEFAKKFVEELDALHVRLAEAEFLYEVTEEWVTDFLAEVKEEK